MCLHVSAYSRTLIDAYAHVQYSSYFSTCITTFNAPRPSLLRVPVKKGPDPAFPLLFH